jgi:hypothetical protein
MSKYFECENCGYEQLSNDADQDLFETPHLCNDCFREYTDLQDTFKCIECGERQEEYDANYEHMRLCNYCGRQTKIKKYYPILFRYLVVSQLNGEVTVSYRNSAAVKDFNNDSLLLLFFEEWLRGYGVVIEINNNNNNSIDMIWFSQIPYLSIKLLDGV